MNYYLKYSPFDDLRRIKGGYMPKNHFLLIYDTIPIFIMLKLFVYRSCRNFISDIVNFKGFHKSCQVRKPKTKVTNHIFLMR